MRPITRGVLVALVAASAFGATTPLVQRFGAHVGPFATAALLYAGAAVASAIPGRAAGAAVTRAHAPRLVLVALAGAVIAPTCLAWGLHRTSAIAASLLLNLEAVFTVLLARAFYREPIGGRVAAALACIAAGGAVLVARGGAGETSPLGAAAVAAATLAWAGDNALTRPLSELDPSRVVLAKGTLGALLACALAAVAREPMPDAGDALGLLACGATGYGASLRLYLAAQRTMGAARTASVFAVAPFLGALVAVVLGDRAPIAPTAIAAALCGLGVALHLTEHHMHAHRHDAVDHDHVHRHDDGHHDHAHHPPFSGEHAHPHHHDQVTHDHEHAPDVHHEHTH
jgi:drug/metabolite transporter (DMT)-like permease